MPVFKRKIQFRYRIVIVGLSMILILFFVSPSPTQDEIIVFVGVPDVTMTMSPPLKSKPLESVSPVKLSPSNSSQSLCVISKKGDKYYYKSRENKELIKSRSGWFITFTRADGFPGYVRFFNPDPQLELVNGASYDYVEVLITLLSSITYWGNMSTTHPDLWTGTRW